MDHSQGLQRAMENCHGQIGSCNLGTPMYNLVRTAFRVLGAVRVTTVDLLTGCLGHGPATLCQGGNNRKEWMRVVGQLCEGTSPPRNGCHQPQIQGLPKPFSNSMICWEESTH